MAFWKMKQILTFVAVLLLFQNCDSQQNNAEIKTNNQKEMDSNQLETAVFGGGCYWCVEAVFDQLLGVESVTNGYAGGHVPNPTYEEVSKGTTGHAEVIRVIFKPEIISYSELLEVFWTVHDPTQLNRQGNDVGEQYRSIILYDSEEQKLMAQRSLKEFEASDMYDGTFKTQIVPLDEFYNAEEYMQDYYERTGDKNPYCTLVIKPKVDKFYQKFYDKLKPEYK